MKVLNKLVKQNLLKNKQRTVVSIIGIILSCALITALFGLVISFQETIKEDALKTYGNRHVTFANVLKDDIKNISNNKNIESYYLSNIKAAKVEDKLAGVIGLNKKDITVLKDKLVEGNIPSSENEIVIDVIYADRYNIKIGDEISVTTGERYSEGYKLNDSNPYYKDKETFENVNNSEYKVVGICSYYSYLASKYEYNLYRIDNEIANKSNMHILYNDPKNYNKITAQINGTKTDLEKGKYDISYNSEYLRWAGYAVGDSTKFYVVSMGAIVSFIIIVVSVFCIKNSFTISVSEKTRMYGMLSSIGATPKQIKRNVLKEGWYLGIIGIPIGIISGITASYILTKITANLLNSVGGNNFEMIYKISISSILLSVVLASITIYLSAIGSARRASKITEIEAIIDQKEIKLKTNKLKTPKIIKKIFKTGGVLAYKNIKRSKSKYRTTILALVISITSFISISYFIEIGLKQAGDMLGSMSFNISTTVRDTSPIAKGVQEKIYKEISKLNNVDEFSIVRKKMIFLKEEFLENIPSNDRAQAYIFTLSEEEYKKLLNRAKLKYEDVKDKGIVVHNTDEITNEKNERETRKIIKENLTSMEYTDFSKKEKNKMDLIFKEANFMGIENYYGGTLPCIVASEEYFNKIFLKPSYDQIYIKSSNPRQLKKDIKKYEKDLDESVDLYIVDIAEIVDQQNTMVLLISIFLYGFIAVITLIGITNIFNTITTNMMLRQREFAILKSTGMTDKEFINMIRLESLFYGVKSLFFGLTFGIGLSYLMYYVTNRSDFMMISEFKPSFIAIVTSIIFVFVIVNLIMRYSLSKINKQNIIETIRNENI